MSCAKLSKLGARNQLSLVDNSAIVAGARGLAELQMYIGNLSEYLANLHTWDFSGKLNMIVGGKNVLVRESVNP